jgi:hypothetical protein
LDGKVSNVLLSTTSNVVVLVDFKTMTMNFIGKIVNLVSTTTQFDPKSILERQKTLVIKSTMVEPTLNIGNTNWSYLLVIMLILPCISV